jgi:hypothetical protein
MSRQSRPDSRLSSLMYADFQSNYYYRFVIEKQTNSFIVINKHETAFTFVLFRIKELLETAEHTSDRGEIPYHETVSVRSVKITVDNPMLCLIS